MNIRLWVVASLLFTCAACKSAQQQPSAQNVAPAGAVSPDASTPPSNPPVMPPPAAVARTVSADAGQNTSPADGGRVASDAAVTSTADSSAKELEPVCVPARDLPVEAGELEIAGAQRLFYMHVPAELPDKRAAPLVVDLHGLMTHARYQRAHSGFATEADRAGFIVVYPQALDNAWSLGASECCAADSAHDDVAFIRALVTKLQQSACIDSQHIYVVGSDVGGGLAQQLACQASELFAAVVTRDFDLLELAAASCKPARPLPMLALRSDTDPDLPYGGGEVRLSSGLNTRVRMLGAEASLRRWAELGQCSGEPDTSMPNCQRYMTCMDANEVALCKRAQPAAPEDAAAAWAFLQRF